MGVLMLNGIPYSGFPEPPAIYSETEREIGVWIDGKPVYEKTIDFGALPSNTTKTVLHNISNIDKVVNIYGTSWNSSNSYIPLPFVNNTSYANSCQLEANATGVMIRTSANLSSYTNTYVTIQYTKTTDVPGSGKYTPNGLAHHYSNTEQVVGTWIDGKPVYEITYEFSSSISVSNSEFTLTSIDSSNIETVVSCIGIHLDGTSYGELMSDPTRNNHTMLGLQTGRNNNTATCKTIILRYTKTTD